MSVSSIPTFESLLKWLNTFELNQPPCEKVDDLCSGHVILSCLSTVCPEASGSGKDPWIIIMKTLEDYCGCSLDKAVSLEKAKSGDLEHMARVVVLVLCFLVENESINRNVIAQIMELPVDVQQDLMALIKSGLDKVNSDTLSTGKFESGVGVAARAPSPLYESQGSVTPMRPSRHHTRSIVYRGLESPACQRWLKSPAFSRMKIAPKTPLLVSIINSSQQTSSKNDDSSEEVRQLQHQLSILKRKVKSEKQLNADLNTELESMTQTCTTLQEANSEFHLKIQSREEKIKDLVDELTFKESRLKEVESAVTKYKSEAESLFRYKETCRNLEKKMADYESMEAELQEETKKLHILELGQVEKDTELKRLTMAHNLKLKELQLALESKERLHQSLMEMSKERDNLSQRLKHSERERSELEAVAHQKTEQLEELDRRLAAAVGQVESLTTDNNQLKAKMDQASEERKAYQLQMTEKLRATETSNIELQAKLSITIEERDSEVESLQRVSSDLQAKLESAHKVQESLKQQIVALEGVNGNLQAKLDTACKEQGSSKKEVQMLEQCNSELQSELGRAQEVHELCKLQVQALEKTNSNLQVTLSTACEEHKQFERKMSNEMHSLREAKADLQNKLDEALEECQSRNLKSEQVQSLQKTNADLQALLDSAREEHASRQEQLKSKIQAVMLNNADLQAKIEATLEQSKADKSKAAVEMESLQALHADLQAKLGVACGERDSLRLQVHELEASSAGLQTKLGVTCGEQELMRQQVHELGASNAGLQAKLGVACGERDSLRQQVHELGASNAGLQTKLGVACGERDSLRKQVQELEAVSASLQDKLGLVTEERELLSRQVRNLEEHITEVHNKCNREKKVVEQQAQNLKKNCFEIEARLDRERNSWKLRQQELERTITDLKAKLDKVAKKRDSTDSVRDVSIDPSSVISVEGDGQASIESNEKRVSELQRRNKMTLPHLKSSYPIEMQVEPESPSVSNEIIKNGSSRDSKPLQSLTATRESTAFTVPLSSLENLSRKRNREFEESLSSPPASHRRVSAPPTPDSMTTRTRAQRLAAAELRRDTLSSSKQLGLRGFLDEPVPTPVNSSVSFEVNFSPPKAAGRVPKGIRAAMNKASRPANETPSEQRRQTMVSKGVRGTVNKTSRAANVTLSSEQQRQAVVSKRPKRSKK